MNISDARYVLSEIRTIPYYEQKMAEIRTRLQEIDDMIASATAPVSPNGGEDITVKGKIIRIKVHGNGQDKGAIISDLITAQAPLEAQLQDFAKRCSSAQKWKAQLLRTDNAEFVQDFVSGKPYREIQDKYFCSNAYDKMIRIIMQSLRAI